MDMAQGLQQFRALDGDFHRPIQKEAETRTARVARRETFGKPGPAAARGFSMSF
jgi:hypothetical protein